MYFKYDNMSDFLIKLSSNIEIVSCICYGIDTNVGSQVSDIIPYLEHHAIRDAITEKMEEELSKKINKQIILPHFNKNEKRNDSFTVYTTEMVQKVKSIYKDDFELLDYRC